MWTRDQIKRHAKLFLKANYGTAFVVTLIATLLGASRNSLEVVQRFDGVKLPRIDDLLITFNSGGDTPFQWLMNLFGNFLGGLFGMLSISLFLVFLVLRIVVTNNIRVGQARYFTKAIAGDNKFDYLFSSFRNGEWSKHAVKLFQLDVTIFLWSLLLVIPGIIKTYQYKFVPYILSDHPDFSLQQAKDISTQMTNDDKLNLFILDLSFIGWYLLASLLPGIGHFLVEPYPQATEATLYRIKLEMIRVVGSDVL